SSTAAKRCSNRSPMRALSASRPSPVRAETCSASGKRFASRRRWRASTASALFNTSSTGSSIAPISSSTAFTARSCSSRTPSAAGLPPSLALLAQRAQTLLQLGHAPPGQSAVGLELRFAGPARADSAAEALEVLPHAAHPRQVVLELGELDLELALGAAGVLRE